MKILNKFKIQIPKKIKYFLYRNGIKLLSISRLKVADIDFKKSVIFCKDDNVFVEDKLIRNNYIKITKYKLIFVEKYKLVELYFNEPIKWIPLNYIVYINNNLSNKIREIYNGIIAMSTLSLENTNYYIYNENEPFMKSIMIKTLNNDI